MRMWGRRVAVVAVIALSALAAPAPVRAAEQKVKTAAPLLRSGAIPTGQGVVAVSAKGDAASVTLSVAKLPPEVSAPLGVFVEDGPGAGSFTQAGSIDALKKGAGRVALGVSSAAELANLVELGVEVRRGDGAVLLAATFPPLAKFTGTKVTSKLLPADGSPLAKFSGTFSGTPAAKTGSERFLVKAKGLAPGGAYSLWIEDARGSGVFVDAGPFAGGQFLRDQTLGDALPLGAASLADLVGRALEVRDGSGPVGRGAIPLVLFGEVWPQRHVFVIDEPDTTLDRVLRFTSGIVVYRSLVDLTDVSVGQLVAEGGANWRLDPVSAPGVSGLVCTVRLDDDPRRWWIVGTTGGERYLGIHEGVNAPSAIDAAKFVFHFDRDAKGRRTALVESFLHPGEFLVNDGHLLTGNGVRFGTDLPAIVFGVR